MGCLAFDDTPLTPEQLREWHKDQFIERLDEGPATLAALAEYAGIETSAAKELADELLADETIKRTRHFQFILAD